MWWCGGLAGDYIYYATATSLAGPWSTPVVSFSPTGNTQAHFDGYHTCDPSVIKVGGQYYMYYGGYQVMNHVPGVFTKIGVAQSSDGISWQRLNGGAPILVPSMVNPPPPGTLTYGTGQPSAIYLEGWFYLIYSDTTGATPLGQYVLRSSDPTFQTGVYQYLASGWSLVTTTPTNQFAPVLDAQSVDWTYLDAVGIFSVAINGLTNHNSLRFYDKSLSTFAGQQVNIIGKWTEGPGIARRPNGHARGAANCSAYNFDIMRSVCNPPNQTCNPDQWDLSWLGWDYGTGLTSCPFVFQDARNDFSGDGKTELAVFRPNGGFWYILDLTNGAIRGISGD